MPQRRRRFYYILSPVSHADYNVWVRRPALDARPRERSFARRRGSSSNPSGSVRGLSPLAPVRELRSSLAVDRAASSASWPTPAPGEILLNLHLQPARAQIARDEPSRFAAFGHDGGQERLNRGHTKPRPLSASRWGLCRSSWEGAGTGSRRIRSALSVSPSGDQNQCRGRGACVANGSESESKEICVY